MKTLSIFLLIWSIITPFNSQILHEDNFESYSIGTIVGQNNYQISEGDNQSFYQITSGSGGKVLRINSSAPGSKMLWREFTPWTNYNTQNQIFEVEFDFFTGSTTINNSFGGLYIGGTPTNGNFELVGLAMYQHSKRIIASHYNWDTWINNYNLGDNNEDVYLPENSWVRMGISYNTETNKLTFKGPGFYSTLNIMLSTTHISTLNRLEYWVEMTEASGPLVDYDFDNVSLRVVSVESLLNTKDFNIDNTALSVTPNPVENIASLNTSYDIMGVYLYDLTGKRKEMRVEDKKVDFGDISCGTYILGIKTDVGFITRKIIKK